MNITRMEIKRFRNNFKVAVKQLEKDFGISIDLGTVSFSKNEFSTKLSVLNVGDNDENVSSDKLRFEALCERYGFKKSDYERTFTLNRTEYRLIGFKSSNRKYPCVIEGVKGGKYKVSVLQIKSTF